MTNTQTQALLMQRDWAATSLGPRDQWPAAMRAIIDAVLASAFPICSAWGCERIQIYNDAYIPIFGAKHPQAFGDSVEHSWPEIHDFLMPALDQVVASGKPLWFNDTLLPLAKQGVPEECWFDFSYSALPAGPDGVPGILSVAVEKTRETVFERRQVTCDLPLDAMIDGDLEGLGELLRQRLLANPMDAAAAALYRADGIDGHPGQSFWVEDGQTGILARPPQPMMDRTAVIQTVPLPTVSPKQAPEAWAERVVWIPLAGSDGHVLAWLALVRNILVPADSHDDFVARLADRLHRILNHGEMVGRVRRQMDEQDRLYRFLFENIADAAIYAALGEDALTGERILAANPAACRLLGYTVDELIGMERDHLFAPGYAPLQEALNARQRDRTFLGQLLFRRKDGQLIPIEISSRLIATGDGGTRSVNILRDLSQRLAQEAERASQARFEAIAQLTAGIAHDFNNLLTVVLGSLEMLLDELPEGGRAHTCASNALLGARRGASLTSQLLTYTRQQVLNLEAIDLFAHIRGIAPLIQASLGELTNLMVMPSRPLPLCRADVTQLTTAILNLAMNARDAMVHGGHLTLSVDTVTLIGEGRGAHGWSLPAGEYVRLQVMDDGHGIPEALQQRVFDPFFTTKPIGAGSGLGLAMVQGFMHQCGGDVRIAASNPHGTRFELLFPVVPATMDSTATPSAKRVQDAPFSPQEAHVLLVEDNAMVREQLQRLLSEAGYRVSTAQHGREGLEILERLGPFDVVLTDVVMPGGLSGTQMAALIRERHPTIPVLVMTGHDPTAHGLECERPFEILPKPFDRSTLLEAMARQLVMSSPQDSKGGE